MSPKRYCSLLTILLYLASNVPALADESLDEFRTAVAAFFQIRKPLIIGEFIDSSQMHETFSRFGNAVVPELERYIETGKPVDPTTAMILLGCLSGDRGWQVLEGYAHGSNVVLRSTAIRALSAFGSPRSVALLTSLALDPPTAAEAVRALGTQAGVSVFYMRFSHATEPTEYVSAQSDAPKSNEAAAALVELLANTTCSERDFIYSVLDVLHHPDLGPMLPELARTGGPDLRIKVAKALRTLDIMARLPLCRTLSLDPNPDVARTATETLIILNDPSAIPAIARLLGTDDGQHLRQVLSIAHGLPSLNGLEEKLHELGNTDDPDIAAIANGLLYAHGDMAAFRELILQLRLNRNRGIAAGRAVKASLRHEDLPAVMELLVDPDFDVRRGALNIVLAFDDTRVLDWVLCNFHSYDGLDRAYVASMKQELIRYVSRFPNDAALRLLTAQIGRDDRLRYATATGLSRIPNRDALPFLRDLLSAPMADENRPAIRGIARFGGAEEIPLLLDVLDASGNHTQLRREVCNALKAITGETMEAGNWRLWWQAHQRTFDPIAARIKMLTTDTPEDALFFLLNFGDKNSCSVLRRLIDEMVDEPHKQIMLARTLIQLGDPYGLPYVLRQDAEPPAMRENLAALHAATGIWGRRQLGSVGAIYLHRLLQTYNSYFADGGKLNLEWRRHSFAQSAERNAGALRLQPQNSKLARVLEEYPDIPEHHRNAVQNPDGLIRQQAVRQLDEADSRWRSSVLQALLNDRDVGVRLSAALELSRLDDPALSATMRKLIMSDDQGVRGYAAKWLGKHHVTASIPELLDAYEATVGEGREALAWGLGEFGDPSLLEFYVSLLDEDHFNIRRAAVYGLMRLPSPVALPPLKFACGDSDQTVRSEAVKAVVAQAGPEGYAFFHDCLTSPVSEIRKGGLFGVLCYEDQPFPTEEVWQALHSSDSSVRNNVMRALTDWNIGGKRRGPVLRRYLLEENDDRDMRMRVAQLLACGKDPLALLEIERLTKAEGGQK